MIFPLLHKCTKDKCYSEIFYIFSLDLVPGQNADKATPGVLRTVLVAAPQKRHSGTGKGEEGSDSNDDWAGAPPI